MGSSKYEFDSEQLDKDVRNKMEVIKQFKKDLEEVLHREYKYQDGQKMSQEQKESVLIRVHREFIEGE